jgi:hypothetical protein
LANVRHAPKGYRFSVAFLFKYLTKEYKAEFATKF